MRTTGSRARLAGREVVSPRRNAWVMASAKERPWMGERAERLERRLERPMLVAAALVIPAVILEAPDVGPTWKAGASILNWAIWLAFLAELVAMLAAVRDRRRYLIHNPLSVAI